ncbi:MAG: tetratricopeptide repeat protein [Anaerolineae bacterium]|nr:tetratricopeptide repeat protein [Anaerolineae bacterium]
MIQNQRQLISTLLDKGEIKRAEMIVAKHLRSQLPDEDRSSWLVYRARARLASARPEEALNDLFTAQRFAPTGNFEKPELLELQADCYLARFEMASVGFADRSDTRQASQLYLQILDRYPGYLNTGWVYYQLGRVALTDNQNEQAEIYFRQALFAPSTVKTLTAFCYERLGFIAFYEQRDYANALGFLRKAVDTYPASEKRTWLVQVYILQSKVLREMHDYAQALTIAEQALSIALNSTPEDRHSVAEALLTAGELTSGLEGRERDVVNYLQQFLQNSRKPLGIDVTWARVHEMLGDAYMKIGQYENAAQSYKAVLDYNPYHPWGMSLHYRIACSNYLQGKYEETIQTLTHLLKDAEVDGEVVNDYRIFDILGSAQFATGRYTDASKSYGKALELAPASADNLKKIKTYYQFAMELS